MKTRPFTSRRGFTLVELLVAIAVLTIILFFLGSAISFVSKTWTTGVGITDNYQKARTIFSTLDRDIQMMVLRPDVAAFRDNTDPKVPANCKPILAFYTNAEGAPGGDNRTSSLVFYGMDSTPGSPTATLLRFSSGLDFTNSSITLPAAATPTTVPGLMLTATALTPGYTSNAAPLGDTDTVATGVIAFQWQFVDGSGNVYNPPYRPFPLPTPPTPAPAATPFTYDFNNPGTPSNPRSIVISMVVISNSANQMMTPAMFTIVQNIFTNVTVNSNETYSTAWNAALTTKMAAPTAGVLPPVMAGLRVFSRCIPLPGTTPSSS